MLLDRNEAGVELVELGLIVLGPLSHLGCAAHSREDSNDVFLRRHGDFVTNTSRPAG